MNLKMKNKKGFAFSLFAFFLVFVIYGFGSLYFFEGDYGKMSSFNEARILYINNEISYFKDVYIKNVFSFSTYNTLESLILYSSNNSIDKDYKKFNDLMKEGLINGSFNSDFQTSMDNKTIVYFIDTFKDNFEENYRGNFNYQIENINVFDSDSYYISVQVGVIYNITTDDNISSWNIKDEFIVTVPVFDLTDPEFIIQDNQNYTLRPAEYYKSGSNWSLELLNETISETFSSIYVEPNYKYSIGTSFVNRLLNFSQSSYKDVSVFLSFDYDEEEKGVYDSSLNFNLSKHFGNTRLLMNFDNESLEDFSSYENDGVDNGVSLENSDCVSGSCYTFNGVSSYIDLGASSDYEFDTESFSVVTWFKTDNLNLEEGIIGSYENDGSGKPFFILGVVDGKLQGQIGEAALGDLEKGGIVISQDYVNNSFWHQGVLVREGNLLELYVDGILSDIFSAELVSFDSTMDNIYLGSQGKEGNYFKGNIDEVGIYSKALTSEEISDMYLEKKVKFVDYKDSLYEKSIKFDGIDDYVQTNINSQLDLQNSNFTIELWLKRISNISNSEFILGSFDNFNKQEFSLNFEDGKFKFSLLNTLDNFFNVSSISQIENDKWTYIALTYNTTSDEISIFYNGVLENKTSFSGSVEDLDSNIFLGGHQNSSSNFSGYIDEFKVYNRLLTKDEIIINYYNYDSSSKGCCNYINLINPNKMGYNSLTYNDDISYSSKLFYDYYKRGEDFKNISLVSFDNITSDTISENYYNLKLDFCLMNAYNVYDYVDDLIIFEGENDTNSCSSLIRKGIY